MDIQAREFVIVPWEALEPLQEGKKRPSRQSLARWEEKGIWPRRVQISPGRIGWLQHEVEECRRQRIEARNRRQVRGK